MITPERILEIRQQLALAQYGLPHVAHRDLDDVWTVRDRHNGRIALLEPECHNFAKLYARAPRDIADLLAEVDRLTAARDAYAKAKAENDERFMLERDEARRERDELRATLDNTPPEGWLPTWDLELEDEDEIHGDAAVTLWVSPFDGKHTKYVGVASDEPYVFFWAIHFGINPSEVSRPALTGDAPTARAAMLAADNAAKASS